MKKILLVLFYIGYTTSLFAQNYIVEFKGSVRTSGISVSCEHEFFAELLFNDGTKITPFHIGLDNRRNTTFGINSTNILEKNKIDKLYGIRFSGSRGRSGFWGGCKVYSDFNRYPRIVGQCQKTIFNNLDIEGGVLSYSNIEMFITPIINISTPIDILQGNDDYAHISVANDSKGFSSDVYQWEYQIIDYKNGENINSNNWLPMPAKAIGKESFKIKPNELLEDSQILGKRIFFRIKTCNGESKNNIWIDVVKSAPKILSHQETAPLCFDGKGAVSFTFDRTLLPDETAEFVLDGENQKEKNPSLNQHLVEQLRDGITVTLPDAEHGTHTLSIVGTYKGQPTYSGAEQSRQFTITPPTPVEFSVTSSQNVLCHRGNDGHIQLSASGGLGDYQYSLDNGSLGSILIMPTLHKFPI